LAQSAELPRWQFVRLSPYDGRPAAFYGRHCGAWPACGAEAPPARRRPGNPSL